MDAAQLPLLGSCMYPLHQHGILLQGRENASFLVAGRTEAAAEDDVHLETLGGSQPRDAHQQLTQAESNCDTAEAAWGGSAGM